MATSYKTLLASDITPIRSNLHEAIPITGSIISGTYGPNVNDDNPLNVKNYSHGMFTSIYDYPYLSSSANHIFDVSFGIGQYSILSASTTTQIDQKLQIYNQMAQVLAGNDPTGSIIQFDKNGTNSDIGTDKLREVIFLNMARLLSKDEIQKGSFSLTLGVDPTGSGPNPFARLLSVTDASGSNNYKVNSPAGDYGILYATGSEDYVTKGVPGAGGFACGLLYYQAGIAVLTASLFNVEQSGGLLANDLVKGGVWPTAGSNCGFVNMQSASLSTGDASVNAMLVSASMSSSANAFLNRIQNVSFNNTTELNSTVYFCRANSNEFNYSSNPTYLSQSKIRVKEVRSDEPSTYVTSVGLYSPDNALLAVAKLSEPIKKQPSNEFTLRVRLDY